MCIYYIQKLGKRWQPTDATTETDAKAAATRLFGESANVRGVRVAMVDIANPHLLIPFAFRYANGPWGKDDQRHEPI